MKKQVEVQVREIMWRLVKDDVDSTLSEIHRKTPGFQMDDVEDLLRGLGYFLQSQSLDTRMYHVCGNFLEVIGGCSTQGLDETLSRFDITLEAIGLMYMLMRKWEVEIYRCREVFNRVLSEWDENDRTYTGYDAVLMANTLIKAKTMDYSLAIRYKDLFQDVWDKDCDVVRLSELAVNLEEELKNLGLWYK